MIKFGESWQHYKSLGQLHGFCSICTNYNILWLYYTQFSSLYLCTTLGRVVIYDHRAIIRLSTKLKNKLYLILSGAQNFGLVQWLFFVIPLRFFDSTIALINDGDGGLLQLLMQSS